ncbi:hypothetical protein ISF62_18265 [Burkholderia pseudomallei]|uniref:hypothetical protein n=1 Tax=Burkholderia pseudomallei TaxID=28450 RepID=UPI00027FC7D7|nr:hypothetical protein [Burkholderia pseudomallei]AFR18477.1 hypothetical protein BPC006_II0545 [Burkholderia pseudomallei BPC006]MBF3577464.1 hypothetical protein [Burkholderia pseudomallei]MBF3683645.1 hypothetical protein [Burkholderia pseudomallei]MBF3820819.1 hypothetical protein [Burkholderia pseudomallei]MBF4119599.1 hypothetical protein [Burkholderia pseudomallei]
MSALAWNLALLVGIAMIGIGVGMSDGIPRALVVVGALVLAFNVVSAFVATRKG